MSPNFQPLTDSLTRRLAANIRRMAQYANFQPDDEWVQFEASGLASLASGYVVRGQDECYKRLKPPLGRQRDYEAAQERHEQLHCVSVAATLRLAGLAQPVTLNATYLRQTITALASVDNNRLAVVFAGAEYESLTSVTRAARASVAPLDGPVGWAQSVGGRWKAIDVSQLQPAEVEGSTRLGVRYPDWPRVRYGSARISDGKIIIGPESYDSFDEASAAVRESVVQADTDPMGWNFWRFRRGPRSTPLDTLRRQFWQSLFQSPNPLAFWQANALSPNANLLQFFRRAVVGGNFPRQARDVTRSVSFPLISMPDGSHLDWGEVLVCVQSITPLFTIG